MGNAPENQNAPDAAERNPDEDISRIVGPPTTAIPQQPPANHKQRTSRKKRCYTRDPGIFWLSAAALIALIIYTGYTRLLVIDAENSSAAQAKITREIIQIDQRAWIGIETLEAVPSFPEVGKTFGSKGVIKNTGKTPALNLVIYSIIEPVLAGNRPNFSYTGIKSFRGGMIPPDGRGVLPFNPLTDVKLRQPAIVTQEQLDMLKNRTFGIYTHGRIEYDDIFGSPHWMTYCSYVPVPSIGSFAHCDEHEDTDDNQKTKK